MIVSLWIAGPFRWKVIVSHCKVIVPLRKAGPLHFEVIISLWKTGPFRCKAIVSLWETGPFRRKVTVSVCKAGVFANKAAFFRWNAPIIQKKIIILINERVQFCKKTKIFMIDEAVCLEKSFVKYSDAARFIINLNYAER